MMPILSGILSAVTAAITGFFSSKNKKLESIDKGIDLASEVGSNDAEAARASGRVLQSVFASDSWLAKNWRPITMSIFVGLLVARWFGYSPPNMSEAEIIKMYDLIELGLGGYIGGRSLEKIVTAVTRSKAFDKLLTYITNRD